MQSPQPLSFFAPVRVAAVILDLMIGFFAAFALFPLAGGDARIAVAIVAVAGWIYRSRFKATPGQQIMGLRRVRDLTGKSILVRTTRRGVLAFVGAAFVIGYVALTVGGGLFVRSFTDEKIDARVVNIASVDWTPPARSPVGVEQWNSGAAFEVPRQHGDYKAEFSNCCVIYGPYHSEPIDPGLMIVVRQDLHPFAFCEGAKRPAARYLSGCTDGPLAFQRAVIGASRSRRDIALSPLGVVRRNFELIAKSIYFEDADAARPFRTFTKADTEMVWIAGSVTIRKEGVAVTAKYDRFLLANATKFVAVDLVWKKVPRDEQLAARIASTLSLRDVPQSEASGDAIAHLYNAYRISDKGLVELEHLVAAVEKSGTERERDSLAIHLKGRAVTDATVRDLAKRTAAW